MTRPTEHATSPYFCGEEEIAPAWDLSPGGLALARQRGELQGAYVVVGRRVLWSRLAPKLAALGLRDPAALGAFCQALGIDTLDALLTWLEGDHE